MTFKHNEQCCKKLLTFQQLSSTTNYFDSSIKLYSNLYLAEFFNISAKPFFPCNLQINNYN